MMDVKPGFFGMARDAVQERPNQLGPQGRERVVAVHSQPFPPVQIYL